MINLTNSPTQTHRTSEDSTDQNTSDVLIDGIPTHNSRFSRISLYIDCAPRAINILDAVIWRMGRDTVDIAQFGQNYSSYVLYHSEWLFSITHSGILNIQKRNTHHPADI